MVKRKMKYKCNYKYKYKYKYKYNTYPGNSEIGQHIKNIRNASLVGVADV